jgi:adenine-specific DNA-methyltransferase
MKLKKAILEVMDTDLLRGVLYTLEIEAEDHRSRDSMITALSRSKHAPAEKLIEFIGEVQVKDVCKMVGVDSRGRRGVLIDRLLESGSEKDPQVEEEPTPDGGAAPSSTKWKVGKQKTVDYRHEGEKRKNIPPAKMAGEGKVPKVEKVKYHYNPHLPPVLRFDPDGTADKYPDLIAQAGKRFLNPEEQKFLAEALQQQEPWLEWAGKKEQHEKRHFEVDPVALHIHERVSAKACIRAAMREDPQRDLFADPEQPYKEAVQFYRHDIDWANRLILGDSLQVMSSLAKREGLAGKIQLIYMDPPYGIKFASNFQPEVGKRDVKDKEEDLSREPEMVKAYRDTWNLGVHSYISYLRNRLLISRELLSEDGSIFVQISHENIHRIKLLLDEIFLPENSISVISFRTSAPLDADFLPRSCDYLLWYAKDISKSKFNPLMEEKAFGLGTNYMWI